MLIKTEHTNEENFRGLKILDYISGMKVPFSFSVITVKKDQSYPPGYSSKSEKFYYVVKGNIVFTIEGEVFEAKKGELILVKKNHMFTYENRYPASVEMILINTPPPTNKTEFFSG